MSITLHLGPYVTILGYLSAYDWGPTEATKVLRQEWGELPGDLSGYDVFLAVENCDYIGREAVMYIDGKSFKGIVFDCAGPSAFKDGKSWMARQHIAAEVDKAFWDKYPEYIGNKRAIVSIRKHWKDS